MTIPAKYDPDRLPNGHFRPNNSAARGHSAEAMKRFKQVVDTWYDAVTPEEMTTVHAEHLWCITQRENIDAKIKALVLYYDRCGMPKAADRLEIDVNAPLTLGNLTPADELALQGIISKAFGPVIDVSTPAQQLE